jgi:hypothetical protein
MRRLSVVLVFGFGLWLVLLPYPALACSGVTTTADKPSNVTNRTKAAPIVLEGEVLFVTNGKFPPIASIKVAQYFKGNGPEVVLIDNFGEGLGDCKSKVTIGEKLVIYAKGDPKEILNANYFTQYDATDPINPQNIADVIAASGQQPVLPNGVTPIPIATPTVVVTPQPSPMVATITNSAQNNSGDLSGIVWFGAGLVVGGMVTAGIFLLLGRLRNG